MRFCDLSRGFKSSWQRDALKALDMAAGVLVKTPADPDDRQSDAPEIVSMGLKSSLSLLDSDKLDDVISELDNALRGLRTAYRWAIDDPTLLQLRNGDDGPGKNRGGTPPAYLIAQNANLQAGLQRLLATSGGTNFFA